MENLANTFLWIGMIAGGLVVLLLLISMLSGLDVDSDIDTGDGDTGGLGILKSALTFFSIGSFTARAIALNTEWSWTVAITSGVIAGIIAIFILSQVLKLLLSQQEEGNYAFWEAEGKTGQVYIPIPKDGIGKITIEINGIDREIPARNNNSNTAIQTREKVLVLEAKKAYLIVEVIENS